VYCMKPENKKEAARIQKKLALYNAVPNVLWSVVHLVPLSVFCYSYLPLNWLYVFIGISFLPFFLPNKIFNKLQLSRSVDVYKKLGVGFVNKWSQNGDIINRMIRKQHPHYKTVHHQRSSIHKLIQQTYAFEKFHWVMFLFFMLVIFYALRQQYFGWAVLLFVNNVLYNVYPNLLQQYIRLKLLRHQQRANLQKEKETF